jgi:hypothetical protein
VYKYLGVELKSGLCFKQYKARIVAEARKRMMLVWAMGMRGGELAVQDCVRVWQALVRPVLEYGTVVWGGVKWEEAEQVQREMGKMILRCSSKMTNEVVWWTLKGRRDFLTLNYWGKIVGGMSPRRLVWQVYHASRSRYDDMASQNDHNEYTQTNTKWCRNIHSLLQSIGMEDTWNKNTLTRNEAKNWRYTVREKIKEREEIQWKQRMRHKPKLRTYRQLKTKLQFEHTYLTMRDREAREVMTRLRGGTNELRIETGRYAITNRDRRLDLHERRCLICWSGEIEDETHFVLDCAEYEDLREKMLGVLKRALAKQQKLQATQQPIFDIHKGRKEEEGRKKLMAVLIGESFVSTDERLRKAVLLFCARAMKRRNNLVRTALNQMT